MRRSSFLFLTTLETAQAIDQPVRVKSCKTKDRHDISIQSSLMVLVSSTFAEVVLGFYIGQPYQRPLWYIL